MLSFAPPLQLIDGISVWADHADPLQYYYLPSGPRLATITSPDGVEIPQFLLIRFRGEQKSGGILTFATSLHVPEDDLAQLRRKIRTSADLDQDPRLTPVPVMDGGVQLMVFGKQTEMGGANPSAAKPVPRLDPADQGPQFVLKMSHAAKPSLYGDNFAVFSVEFDEEGVQILEGALAGEVLPIGIVYSLTYAGLRPAYQVTLHVDWDRVQHHLEEHYGADLWVFSASVDKTLDELIESRVIDIHADSLVAPGDDGGAIDRMDEAILQVKDMVIDAFFKPSLDPYTSEDTLDRVADMMDRFSVVNPMRGSNALLTWGSSDYTRIDRKNLDVSISERNTVKRTIFPQGLLSGVFRAARAAGLEPSAFIRDAIEDDYFDRRTVKVRCLADLDGDDIAAINVSLTYGDDVDNVVFTPGPTGQVPAPIDVSWPSILIDGSMKREVIVSYEVFFTSTDDLDRPTRLAIEPAVLLADEYPVSPRGDRLYGFLDLPVRVRDGYPWDRYSAIDVELRYTDAEHGIKTEDLLRLTEGHDETRWRVMVRDAERDSFEFRLRHRGVERRDVDTGWRTSDELQVAIGDPFPTKRRVQFVPNFSATIQSAFVDVSYRDSAHHVLIEESMEFAAGDHASRLFVADLEDPSVRDVDYAVTVVFADGRTRQAPTSTTRENRVILNDQMVGHRIIDVGLPPGIDFVKRRIARVTARMSYEDPANGLFVEDDLVFTAPTDVHSFEFDYFDPTADAYSYKTSVTSRSNVNRSVPIQHSREDHVVLALPV